MATCPDVLLGRKQQVWVALEDTPGMIAFPSAQDIINPTSDVAMNQETPVTDSREKADTLDVLNVFQGIASEGSATLNFYLRTAGVDKPPQGERLIVAAIGKISAPATGELEEAILDSDTTITIENVVGTLPRRGVIELTSTDQKEQILYTLAEESPSLPGTWTLSNLTRGYNGTTAMSGTIGDSVAVKSRWYAQDTCRSAVSIWVRTDTLLQCMVGSSVTQFTIPFQEEDAVELQFTVSGQRVYNAGRSDLSAIAEKSATSLKVDDARAFFVGQRIQNLTKKDDNAEAGYAVTAINEDTNTLTIAPGISSAWAVDDVITWWMPSGTPVGDEVENRDTVVFVAGESLVMLPGSLSIGTPVGRIATVGTRFPGQGIDTTRNITIDYTMLATNDAAVRLRDGFEGTEQRFDAVMGNRQGRKMAAVGPRMKLTTASVTFQDPAVTLASNGRFLGIKGEDSLQLILE